MKVLIDITDEQHKVLGEQIKKVADTEEFCLSSTEIYNTAYLFLSALESGIVIDGLTNGEVMQKIFPDAKFNCTERLQTAGLPRRDADFDLAWWNAKWGEA